MCDVKFFPRQKTVIKEKQLSFRLKAHYLVKDRVASNTFISSNPFFRINEKISFHKKYSKKESDDYFSFLDNENNKIYFNKGGCFLIKLLYEGSETKELFYFNICIFSRLHNGKIKKHTYSSPNVDRTGNLMISTMLQLENDDIIEVYPQSNDPTMKCKGFVKLTIIKTTCEGPKQKIQ
jgi:hypothetical protein